VWFLVTLPVAVLAAGQFGGAQGGAALRTRLYSNVCAGRVVGLQAALAGELVARGVPQLVVNLLAPTPKKVAAALPDYPQVAATLASLGGSWKEYDPAAIQWGFADGDKEAFLRACGAGLRPLESLLAALGGLQDDENGRPGQYETAILPLLEALDCPDVLSAAALTALWRTAKDNRHDYLADALLRPLFGLVEEIAQNPLRRLPELLPNLAWQVEQGLLEPLFHFKLRLLKLEWEILPCKSPEELLALAEPLLGLQLPPVDWHRLAKANRVEASALLVGWGFQLWRNRRGHR
jgi:hypothetical protein